MTYYGGKELALSFRTVRANTIQIAEEIPESQYSFTAAPDVRPVGRLLVHIALTPGFQLYVHQHSVSNMATVPFLDLLGKFNAEEARPRSKADIVDFLKTEGERFASYVEGLPESFLAEIVTMAPGAQPPVRSRLEMLLSPKEHEMHHRGQLMLVQRMIGIVPHLTRQFQQRVAAIQSAAPARN
jgi:uncharacterized damage-inducible protein DinB